MITKDPIEIVNSWIESNVSGKTFADVGGIGLQAINEKVTLAYKSGASKATMIDIRPFDFYEWDDFKKKCEIENVKDYSSIDKIDINNSELLSKVGKYDIVYCAGIVYHLPNPVWGVHNLSRIVNEMLIINTVILPQQIENSKGKLEFSGSESLFLPGLNDNEREILNDHYVNKFNMTIDYMAPRLDDKKPSCPWFEDGKTTCWPYWWLFSESSFKALVTMVGFEILDSILWEDHALTLLAQKTTSNS